MPGLGRVASAAAAETTAAVAAAAAACFRTAAAAADGVSVPKTALQARCRCGAGHADLRDTVAAG